MHDSRINQDHPDDNLSQLVDWIYVTIIRTMRIASGISVYIIVTITAIIGFDQETEIMNNNINLKTVFYEKIMTLCVIV